MVGLNREETDGDDGVGVGQGGGQVYGQRSEYSKGGGRVRV